MPCPSMHGSKIILDRPNHFGPVPICFGRVKIIKNSPEKSNLNLSKTIWTVQNHFELIEGEGIFLEINK